MSASSFCSNFSYSLGGCSDLDSSYYYPAGFVVKILLMFPCYFTDEAARSASFILARTKLCGFIEAELLFKLSTSRDDWAFLVFVSLSKSSTFKFIIISIDDLI